MCSDLDEVAHIASSLNVNKTFSPDNKQQRKRIPSYRS
jgi:hypothetical protein